MTDMQTRLTELAAQARALADAGQNDTALRCVEQAFALAPEGLPVHPASVLLGTVATTLAFRLGDVNDATRYATSALAVAEALGDRSLLAHAWLAQARASLTAGDTDHALIAVSAAWPEARDGDDLELRLWCQTVFSNVYKELGDEAATVEWLRGAQITATETGSERHVALTASNMIAAWVAIGDQAHAKGEHAAAKDAWEMAVDVADKAIALVKRHGLVQWEEAALINRAGALMGLGRHAEAMDTLADSDRLAMASNSTANRVYVALFRARLLHRQGHLESARAEAGRGIALGETGSACSALIDLYPEASDIEEACGDLPAALRCSRRQYALYLAMSADRAAIRSKALTVRLATEQAQAEALAAHKRAATLQEAHSALERHAEVLERQALQDPLTGLANRRKLDRWLHAAHAESVSQRTPLYVLMIDIDHFKAINDKFSHVTGDHVLQQMGTLLSGSCRAHELAARYGGEEFVVALPGVKAEQATGIAERLRSSIEAFKWATLGHGLRVTVSIGVYNVGESPSLELGMERVDNLLYRAKSEGRNRVAGRAAK